MEQIVEAERRVELRDRAIVDTDTLGMTEICQAADKQLFQLVEWAKHVPHFNELSLTDRVVLLRAGNKDKDQTISKKYILLNFLS